MIKYSIHIIFALTIIALLSSCSDDALFNENDVKIVEQYIYVIPDRFSGEPYEYSNPKDSVFLEVDETVKFWAVYSVDNTFIKTGLDEDYIQGKKWQVDDDLFNLTSFRYSFDTVGYHRAILTSTDYFNDTITDTLNIFVNTPVKVQISTPENGDNLTDPTSDDGVDLFWNVTGIDSWEKAECEIFFALTEEEVWNSPRATGDCDKNAHIIGPLFDDLEPGESVTIYWGIVATSSVGIRFVETDTSDIFHFTTRFVDSDSATLEIPIIYKGLWNYDSLNTRITLVSAMGDTIGVQYCTDSIAFINVTPQTGLHLYFENTLLTEYKADDISIDVSVAAPYVMDTVLFTDSISPFLTPARDSFSIDESIQFLAMDQGSGINENRINVIVGEDTLTATFEAPIIAFENPCINDICFVKVQVLDNAKNQSPNVYWKLYPQNESTYIDGPYSQNGELE